MKKILIVEDEKKINHLIKETLTAVGYQCFQAFYGMEALSVINKESLNVIILDVQLPDINGFALMKSIHDVPVIFLTARDSIESRVKGLELGAEDYMIKPFAIDELLARINVVLRRSESKEVFVLGELSVELATKKVKLSDQEVMLSPQEYALLQTFILNKNIALTREQLINQAWGIDYIGEDRTVDVHVQRLRKKLNLTMSLKTLFKYGYRLDVM